MNGPGHRRAANATWLALSIAFPVSPLTVLCGAAVASATSSDDYSPDVDQRGLLAKLLPGGHRGLTHMPEVVALLAWALIYATTQAGFGWFGWAVTAGWGSHLAADLLFGRIPFLILGGRRLGLPLDTGGNAEGVVSWLLGLACVPLLWLALGLPGSREVLAAL